MKFSERQGYKAVRSTIQDKDIDDVTRNCLWNVVVLSVFNQTKLDLRFNSIRQIYSDFYIRIWHNFFKLPVDRLKDWPREVIEDIRVWFYKARWFEIYDFIEFLCQDPDCPSATDFMTSTNKVLETEKCAFRIVDHKVIPISNEAEIASLAEATMNAQDKFSPARQHISTAIKLCFDRKSPDYRNSVKESISAIEAAVVAITGNKKSTLGSALKQLGKADTIHPALAKGFSALYGYTSDAKGIRHALLDESEVTFDEAKYMVVSCSSFLNLLTSLSKSK